MMGRWTDDGEDCSKAIEFTQDGRFVAANGGTGLWNLEGDRLTMTGARHRDDPDRADRPEHDHGDQRGRLARPLDALLSELARASPPGDARAGPCPPGCGRPDRSP